jgi:hypothetical protein
MQLLTKQITDSHHWGPRRGHVQAPSWVAWGAHKASATWSHVRACRNSTNPLIEGGGGGVEGGGAEVGQPNGVKKNFTVIRVSRRRGYSPYTRYIIGIGRRNLADTKNFIYGIGWLTSADTNKARLINTAHTPLSGPSTQWRRLLFRPRLFPFFEVFFQLSLICVFPFFAMLYIDFDFNFTMISLMDLGLFPCIYSKRYRIILMYIF